MTYKTNSAEGGSNGTGVTIANSANSGYPFSVVNLNAGTINYTSAQAMHGLLSYEFTQPTTANSCYVCLDDVGSVDFSIRYYLRLTSLPGADTEFPLGLRTTADVSVAKQLMRTTGITRFTNTAGAVAYTGTVVPSLNTWYRYAIWGTGAGTGTATLNYAMYAGDSLTPLESTQITNFSMTGGTVGRIRLGKGTTATLSAWQMDDFAINLGVNAEIGPYEADNTDFFLAA
jgi:hypothetical protein